MDGLPKSKQNAKWQHSGVVTLKGAKRRDKMAIDRLIPHCRSARQAITGSLMILHIPGKVSDRAVAQAGIHRPSVFSRMQDCAC